MNITNPNQTLETAPLTNNNIQNLNAPQMNPAMVNPMVNPQMNPAMVNPMMNPQMNPGMVNPTNAPQFNQNASHQVNPNISVSPTITNAPNITVNVTNDKPKRAKTFIPLDLGLDPETITCPHCEETITTDTKKIMNMKALLIAIGTFYVGLVLTQVIKGKSIGCEDCEHTCPLCKRKIGKYNAL